jgi:hypothetical protein
MSEWVKCTLPGTKTTTHINLAAAISVTRLATITRIGFASKEAHVDVVETPEEIFKQLAEARRSI